MPFDLSCMPPLLPRRCRACTAAASSATPGVLLLRLEGSGTSDVAAH